ncbi:transferase family-domain-containing protein [Tricladium varicosporioides]|nr:transferase family-domain-containing protein [Hymenoscyphus varicosporioides]
MTGSLEVEQLTPLDLIMPRIYTGVLLSFSTAKSNAMILQRLQQTLDITSKQIPWICGRVFPSSLSSAGQSSLEIRWGVVEETPTIRDKGSIEASYKALIAGGLPLTAIPANVWPLSGYIDDALYAAGAPVFGASLFRFGDNQGVGLCVCIHHQVVDAGGLAEVLRLWIRNIAGSELPYEIGDRFGRLSKALSSDLAVVSSQSLDSLLEAHPEYSIAPPALPSEFPPCISKVFAIPMTWIDEIKERLCKHTEIVPTTNTILCAFLWYIVTRIRTQRDAALSPNETSRLAMAVNGRRRISQQFSTSQHPYFGNIILYSVGQLTIGDLTASERELVHGLARICDAITRSNSPTIINSRHIAQVYSLVERVDDYRSISIGWDAFSGRDLTITSWADLELYDMDFGPELGKPNFVRIPYTEADGVCIVLPRKRAGISVKPSSDVVEIVVMLRRDDMKALEGDTVWKEIVV